MDFQEVRSILSAEIVVFLMGRVARKKTQPPMQDRCLFSRIGMLRERVQKIISKEKEVTMDSMLGYFPYTLFQTLTRKGDGRGGGNSLHRPTSSI